MKKKLRRTLKQVFYFALVLALIVTTMPKQVVFATDHVEAQSEENEEVNEEANVGLLTGIEGTGITLLAANHVDGPNIDIDDLFDGCFIKLNAGNQEYDESNDTMKVSLTIDITGLSADNFGDNPEDLSIHLVDRYHELDEIDIPFLIEDEQISHELVLEEAGSYKVTAIIVYGDDNTNIRDEKTINIERKDIVVENQEQVTITADKSVTEEELTSYYAQDMFHNAECTIYESNNNYKKVSDNKCLFEKSGDSYIPKKTGTTYLTVKYEQSKSFNEAKYLVPYVINAKSIEASNVQIELPASGYKLNESFTIKVTYTMPREQLANDYKSEEYFKTEIKFPNNSANNFTLDNIIEPSVKSEGCNIVIEYVVTKEDTSKLGSLADDEFECYPKFIGDSSCPVVQDVDIYSEPRQYCRYEAELDWDGTSNQYELNFNKVQNINLKLKFVDYIQSKLGYTISVPDEKIISIVNASKGTFKTKRCGEVDITIDIPKQLFLSPKTYTRTIKVITPEAPADIIRFNGSSWENVKGSFYQTNDTYWAAADVQVSVKEGNDYFNAATVYTGLVDGCKDIPSSAVGTELPCSLDSDTIIQHTFYIYHAGLGTYSTQNYTFGVDKNEPKNDSNGIQVSNATPITYNQDETTYFNKLPKLTASFSDSQSGIDKIYISYVKDGHNIKEEMTTTVENGIYHITDTLDKGIYSNIKVIARDHVGNEKEVQLYDGKQIIIDTEKPVISLQSIVRDRDYDGNWTNQQIEFSLGAEECLSGIREVKYAYVPNGKTVSANNIHWTNITISANGKYEVTVGEENVINDLDPTDANAVNAIIATAILGVSPYDKNRQATGATAKSNTLRNTVQPLLRNGTFYFVATSKAQLSNDYDSVKQRVRLQQRDLCDGAMYVDQLPAETKWYNEKYVKNKPYLSFTYPNETQQMISDEECPIALSLHYKIENTTTTDNVSKEFLAKAVVDEGLETIVYDKVEGYPVNDEGEYIIYVWTTDEANNRSATQKYIVKADYTPPTEVKIFVAGEDVTKDADDKSIHYTQFFDSSVDVSAKGNFNLSGFDKIVVYEAHNPGDKGTSHSFNKTNANFSIGPNNRCFLYAEATDIAGNTTEVRSEGFVVDNESPIGAGQTELSITPEGANKNGFFNKDFDVNVEVNDSPTDHNSAAIKEVSYMISNSSDHSKTETLFSFSSSAPSSTELEKAENFSDTVTIKAADYESNTAYIEVTSVDNSGNERVTTQELMIDVTLPEITVTYDNNQALHDQYYQQNRTARVEVKELNFDPELVTFDITKDGQSIATLNPAPSSWTDDEDIHYTNITFAEDGDYTLTASCTDLADNESAYDTVDSFTIDKTKPEVTVSYDNETPWKDIYFNTARTATITVVEHNFDASDFSLTSEPAVMVSGWSNDGDTHRATIAFTNDGEYTYGINYADLAGNDMAPFTTEHFKIDTVEPVVAISGVEDQSANAGDIIPVVTVEDEDFDQEGVTISLRNSKGKDIALTRVPSAIPNGSSYVLPNITEQEDEIYYLTVAGTDLAGNTSELSYRFSLNRNGSTYDLSSMSDVVDRVYSNYSVMSDLSILEMNVDRIEKFSIYISRNGSMLESKEVSSRPSNLDENVIYYQVNVNGNDDLGYSYEYTIYQENFQPEGTYNIMFYSKDRAGNEVNNTLNDKGAEITFIIDNTAPKVVVEGVEGYELYAEDSMDVNVYVTDNFKLQQAEFYLVDINGDRVQTWDYMSLVDADSEIATLTIPSSETRQSLLFHAVDAAGNEVTSLPDEEDTPTNFLITTNIWLRFLNTPGAIAAAAGTTVLAGGTCALYFRKRKKLKVVEAKE